MKSCDNCLLLKTTNCWYVEINKLFIYFNPSIHTIVSSPSSSNSNKPHPKSSMIVHFGGTTSIPSMWQTSSFTFIHSYTLHPCNYLANISTCILHSLTTIDLPCSFLFANRKMDPSSKQTHDRAMKKIVWCCLVSVVLC